MESKHADILIIGAGLTGLTLAYLLKDKKRTVKIIEARKRTGGRIHTVYKKHQPPLEMGATWFGKRHDRLCQLLDNLGIEAFEQELGQKAIYEPFSVSPHQIVDLPESSDPSYRIRGGSNKIIEALSTHLEEDQVEERQQVGTITQKKGKLFIKTQDQEFSAGIVISTLPPALFVRTIKVYPELPKTLIDLAQNTHTWMGESIKIGLVYENAFWKNRDISGTIISNVGPIPEMYDHSNFEGTAFALGGFLNGSFQALTKSERKDRVIKQLAKYFGEKATHPIRYEEAVWCHKSFTHAPNTSSLYPHQNNGHPDFQEAYLDGSLYFAGTETSSTYPGYMEGAVRSAEYICSLL